MVEARINAQKPMNAPYFYTSAAKQRNRSQSPESYRLYCDEIESNLWLGSVAATDEDRLKKLNITHLLSLGVNPKSVPEGIVTKKFEVEDTEEDDILQHLPGAVEFIEQALASENGKILVHCFGGVSRSASCVIAYKIKKHQISFEEAYEATQKKRKNVFPNRGFIQ